MRWNQTAQAMCEQRIAIQCPYLEGSASHLYPVGLLESFGVSPGVTAPAGTPGVMDVPQILLPLSQLPCGVQGWAVGLSCWWGLGGG